MSVSVLGLGGMGVALADALLKNGHEVTVWNRSPGRAGDLAERGATVAATPADAVAASPLVLLCVTDFAATSAVLDQVGPVIAGRVLVNLTTATPGEAARTAEWARERGADYLGGAVQAVAAQIGTDEASLVYAGDRAVFERHAPTLAAMGEPRLVGTDPGAAARYDLAMHGLWYDVQTALLDTFAVVGGDPGDFVPFAKRQLGYVVDGVADTAREVRERAYAVYPASLREHATVLEQIVEMRAADGMGPGRLAGLASIARDLVTRGHGDQGFNRVVEELRA
jgi:hypothetical protein